MEQPAFFNKKGMTLIEVIISLAILMIVSVALLQTSVLVMRENLKNTVREEAVSVADQRMNELRSTDFAAIALCGPTQETVIWRNFRSSKLKFTPTKTVTQIGDANTKQIALSVSWEFLGQTYTHSVVTIVRKP